MQLSASLRRLAPPLSPVPRWSHAEVLWQEAEKQLNVVILCEALDRTVQGEAKNPRSCKINELWRPFLACGSLESHVIPAQAGIHRRTPAFAGVTTHVIFIPLGGSQTHGNSSG